MKIWITLASMLLCTCTLFAQKSALDITNDYLQEIKAKHGLTDADLADYHITDNYVSRKSGVTNIYLRQRHLGLDIIGATINLHIKEKEVFHFRSAFLSHAQNYVTNTVPLLSAKQAVLATAAHFDLAFSTDLTLQEHTQSLGQKTVFEAGDLSAEPIPVELFYFPKTRKNVRLVWAARILTTDHQNWWTAYVDAETGEILNTENWVVHCDFGTPEYCEDTPAHTHTHTTQHIENQSIESVAANTYQVFPLTIESPNHGARTFETAPWDPIASPFGWHDTNGANGAEFTITRGNNVYVSDDRDDDNAPGYSPDGGANLEFEFPLDVNQAPINSEDAIATNLFYWNNIVHDIYYHAGFDEASGNFQENNYGNGGNGGDSVNADYQDGSGTNNANFSTPGDGGNPRMQMFLWTNNAGGSVVFTANAPANVSGNYVAAAAQFGTTDYDVTSTVIEVNDGSGAPSEGCNNLVNNLTGNIALVDRGNCQFGTKALNAQNAGAIAVIICQNVADAPFSAAGGDDGGAINIPVVMISQADCTTLRAEIPNLNVTLKGTAGPPNFDSALDNGIIAHEYGHGISTRLTGGPALSCLGNEEQMGEGWSDWFGLALTNLPSHNANSSRGIGTYVIGQNTNGNGIRSFPYSHDMSINPMTYDDIKTEAVPHGVGSVWCTMIWDLYWDLVDEYGYSTDLYNGTAGNNIAMNLIIEGCKLQGCAPGFVDGRDGILAADAALYGGANECLIWEAFARRGLGFSADQGDSGSRADGTEAFDVPPSLEFSKAVDKVEVEEGETLTYTMEARGLCQNTNVTVTDPVPAGTTYVNGSANNGGSESGGTVSYPNTSLAQNITNVYTFDVTVNTGAYFTPVEKLNDDMESGAANWSTAGSSGANFSLASSNPNSGTSHWLAQNVTFSSDQLLTIATQIPVTGAPELTFSHYFDTEATWDGGVVEVSTDNGASWEDIGDYFTQNGYNSFINANPASTLGGRPGFTGNSGTYIESKALLCAYAGNNVLIRFHFATDSNTGGDGWYIDDVLINEVAVISNVATGSASDVTLTSSACTAILEPLILPVELLDFKAVTQEKTINLNWRTANEVNFSGFELLRKSEYDNAFEKIAWIAGGKNNYAHTDQDISPNTTYYYQLRSVDLDGTSKLSKIVSARLKGKANTFQIFPNPVKDGQLYIQINDNALNSNVEATISFVNTGGQVVFEQNTILNSTQTLDVNALPSGVYIVKIATKNDVFTSKFLVD